MIIKNKVICYNVDTLYKRSGSMNIHYHLVGLGYIGKIHLMAMNNFHMVNMPLESGLIREQLITRNPQKIDESLQSGLGFKKVIKYEELSYDQQVINLVDICNPNVYHHDLLIHAIDNQAHVYCEKPLTMNGLETKDVVKHYEKGQSKIQLCYTMRYLPAFAKARAAIKNDAIGAITSFRIEYYHSSYLNPDKPYAWRLDEHMSGGGALFDLGSHAFDILQFLVAPVKEVLAYSDTVIKTRKDQGGVVHPVTVDDWSLIHLLTEDDVRGTVEVSRIAAGDEGIRVRLYGTKGSLMVDVFHNPYDVVYHNLLGQQCHLDEPYYMNDAYYQHVTEFYPTEKLSGGFFLDSHMASLASFISQIEEDDIIEGVPSLQACQSIEGILSACNKSIKTGRNEKIEN